MKKSIQVNTTTPLFAHIEKMVERHGDNARLLWDNRWWFIRDAKPEGRREIRVYLESVL